MNEAAFRAMFPEFWDAAKFPSATVAIWLPIAAAQINASRWGELTPLGIGLWTAHYLALSAREGGAGSARTPGGSQVGVMTSKSGGGVSASYDATIGTKEGAGDLNLTTYGIRLSRLLDQMGAGPVQISGSIPPGVILYGASIGLRSD